MHLWFLTKADLKMHYYNPLAPVNMFNCLTGVSTFAVIVHLVKHVK